MITGRLFSVKKTMTELPYVKMFGRLALGAVDKAEDSKKEIIMDIQFLVHRLMREISRTGKVS